MSVGVTSLVLATANPDKAAEMAAILEPAGVSLVPRPPWVPPVEETGSTLEENALLKARALVAATGSPSVADDTGLEVVALDGAPGVQSARFAGEDATYEDNVALLLSRLEGVPDRRARFRTVAVAAFPDGSAVVAEGMVEGAIGTTRQGSGGFGYDPVFVPTGGGGRSFAEMTPAEKNARSHRARAFSSLVALLKARNEEPDRRQAERP
ncbi:MAG: RdgB/HAM1 family non-canonical purine NTP pyrophosphatase [Acidimicrobiales bacterium]|nr:RdgB/HAM1 family non-canonical purine NTP pyrophosphatase [Acidimicrobiales bacterium]MBO0885899.1 RdgB/HAM1 family non-canonical purine NTP pyrophosphatase [Acidimicrobiales bacterium]MBO0892911.1 RdgB/HAM1 family non-canonical purine NTP pyrophosphatase [Acidimicrobiales bacterium]